MGDVRSSIATWKAFHSAKKPLPSGFASMAATASAPRASASSQLFVMPAASSTGNFTGISWDAATGSTAATAAARIGFFMGSALSGDFEEERFARGLASEELAHDLHLLPLAAGGEDRVAI